MKRKNDGFYYTLTFALKFDNDYDCVYMAHCYPYTYSQLCRYLRTLESDQKRKKYVKRIKLCDTIADNNCDYLIITNDEEVKPTKSIILTSRVHPGETMVSYVIENVINFITGDSQQAKFLRKNFTFKIIPMLNIDGVINGTGNGSILVKNFILQFFTLNN